MEEKNIICTVCPRGCRIAVTLDGKSVTKVEGNLCVRGKKYATDEATEPRRVITTTVRCGDEMLSVKTSAAVRKEKIEDYMKVINSANVTLPIKIGDVIIKNIDGESTDIIATKNLG